MKKRFIRCFLPVFTALVMLCTVLTATASSYEQPSTLPISTQLLYAKLQLEMAEISKQQVEETMNQIKATQEELKKALSYLNDAKQLQTEAKENDTETEAPEELTLYLTENGFSRNTIGDNWLLSANEWQIAINFLQTIADSLNLETQSKMIYLQNIYGQYNSYLNAYNQNSSSNTITTLPRVQSMYGDSEVGLALTALVLGLVLGCALTLVAQKTRKKKDEA